MATGKRGQPPLYVPGDADNKHPSATTTTTTTTITSGPSILYLLTPIDCKQSPGPICLLFEFGLYLNPRPPPQPFQASRGLYVHEIYSICMNAVTYYGELVNQIISYVKELKKVDMFLVQSAVTCCALFWYVISRQMTTWKLIVVAGFSTEHGLRSGNQSQNSSASWASKCPILRRYLWLVSRQTL